MIKNIPRVSASSEKRRTHSGACVLVYAAVSRKVVWKALWVVLSSLFFREIWKNWHKRPWKCVCERKGKQQKWVWQLQSSGTVYQSYPILPFGIVACTLFPTTFLEIAVLLRHDAYCPITLSVLLVLKSGQLIANQMWEFCYSYDYNGKTSLWEFIFIHLCASHSACNTKFWRFLTVDHWVQNFFCAFGRSNSNSLSLLIVRPLKRQHNFVSMIGKPLSLISQSGWRNSTRDYQISWAKVELTMTTPI